MSNRKREPQQPSGMPVVPRTYCNQYQYSFDGQNILLTFGEAGQSHVGVAMGMNLFLDLLNKVQESVIDIARRNANAPQSEQAPTSETKQ